MKVLSIAILALLIMADASCRAGSSSDNKIITFFGSCDASAAAALDSNTIVVADDENNVLRVYKFGQGGLPIFSYDVTGFLGTAGEYPEADIEGATVIGSRIYWLTSHGRNRDGKPRPNRYRFFATEVQVKNGSVAINPVGKPCSTLIIELVKTKAAQELGLDRAAGLGKIEIVKKDIKKLAPKREGINVEGLCASADGNTIYIGFRNPRPQSKAIVVPLTNAADVIEKEETPVFGEPMLWDLRGLGIRSMEYSRYRKEYFIVAGRHDDRAGFVLYRWSGIQNEQSNILQELDLPALDFSPEALVTFKDSPKILLLSDDGTVPVMVSDSSECAPGELLDDGRCPQKFLTDPNKKRFRGILLD